MTARVLVAVLAGTLVLAGVVLSAGAPTTPVTARAATPPPPPGAALERLGRRAAALVSTPAGLEAPLRFAAARAGVRAQYDTRSGAITVFLRPGDAPHRVAHDIAHELGHAWDDRFGTEDGRGAYLRARGVPEAAWLPAAAGPDYATGAGDFAEVFARCHAASPDFRSTLSPPPADACATLTAAGLGAGG